MAMTPQLWSLSGLEVELGRDRRMIGKALAGVDPDDGSGKTKRWFMKTVIAAMYLSGDDLDLTEERARLAKEQADKTEMENAVRRRDVLERGEVDQAVISEFARVRAHLLAIPPKYAPRLAKGMDPAAAEGLLRDAIHSVLRQLSEPDFGKDAGN